jgi:hypothetical protein
MEKWNVGIREGCKNLAVTYYSSIPLIQFSIAKEYIFVLFVNFVFFVV